MILWTFSRFLFSSWNSAKYSVLQGHSKKSRTFSRSKTPFYAIFLWQCSTNTKKKINSCIFLASYPNLRKSQQNTILFNVFKVIKCKQKLFKVETPISKCFLLQFVLKTRKFLYALMFFSKFKKRFSYVEVFKITLKIKVISMFGQGQRPNLSLFVTLLHRNWTNIFLNNSSVQKSMDKHQTSVYLKLSGSFQVFQVQ